MVRNVPLFDCRLDEAAVQSLQPLLASGALASGPAVAALEGRLESRFPDRFAVAIADMTQALALALRVSGVQPGDEVLTLAVNCMSSNTAITLVGAIPIWVDVNPQSLTIDLADCARALTPRTKALIVYHVAGYPADLDALERFCREHDLVFIEDANAALGACSAGRQIGTGGRFAIISFYANRQVNAVDGAALLCADPVDAERARRLRRFGVDVSRFRDTDGEIASGFDVAEVGFPASLSNVNATLACQGLDTLDFRLAATRANAAAVAAALADTNITPVTWRAVDAPAFWVLFVRQPQRDALMRFLKARGIQCSRLHQRNDGYSCFSTGRRHLPGTDAFQREHLALPIGSWLTQDQRDGMIDALRAWGEE